jgi:hypothetical protein
MINKIKYTCKNCGWETSIREEWGDLKPKRCMNKKCNASFLARPDMLVTQRPVKKKVEKKKEATSGVQSRKKTSSKSSKQQEKSQADE